LTLLSAAFKPLHMVFIGESDETVDRIAVAEDTATVVT
jgi:hypothetical protein